VRLNIGARSGCQAGGVSRMSQRQRATERCHRRSRPGLRACLPHGVRVALGHERRHHRGRCSRLADRLRIIDHVDSSHWHPSTYTHSHAMGEDVVNIAHSLGQRIFHSSVRTIPGATNLDRTIDCLPSLRRSTTLVTTGVLVWSTSPPWRAPNRCLSPLRPSREPKHTKRRNEYRDVHRNARWQVKAFRPRA